MSGVEWLPRDREKRWNRMVAYGLILFIVWVAAIVISSAWGDNVEVGDDALLVGAAGAFLTLILNQFHHGSQIAKAQEQIEQVYEHVNNVEDQERIPGDGPAPTIGSLLRSIDQKIDGLQADVDALTRAIPARKTPMA
jgi:hypothetical protein